MSASRNRALFAFSAAYHRGVTGSQVQHGGPMDGHVRDGRRYLPELAATGLLQPQDWVRDDLPDLLWPALVLAEGGTSAAGAFVRWQRRVQAELVSEVDPEVLTNGLDGRLTGLQLLGETCPGASALVREHAVAEGLASENVLRALASYPEVPASWLHERDFSPPGDDDVRLISRAVREAMVDGHREAVLKCLPIWAAVQAGTFSAGPKLIDLLRTYPDDTETRSAADSAIRAAWGAKRGALLHSDNERFDAAIAWAKVFWRINSMTTWCLRKRDVSPSEEAGISAPTAIDADQNPDADRLRQVAMDVVSSYTEALETSPARLYDQERQEVHAGLVARAGRDVVTALGCPDLWCLEHGAHIGRMLVEVRILLQWMSSQDPSIYSRYQAFGAGKAKLYSRILDELPEEARTPEFAEAIEEVARLSHNHGILDYRVVDTSDSFAGKSIRQMATECGLVDMYRQNYYMASGVTHSEWWSVETHAMERCLNVLHRGHLIPSLSLNAGGNAALARAWLDQLYALIRFSLGALGTDQDAVSNAFEWLEEPTASKDES